MAIADGLALGIEPSVEECVADLLGIPVEQVSHEQVFDYLTGEAEPGKCCTNWQPFRAPVVLPHVAIAYAAIGGYGIATGLDTEWPRQTRDLITGFGPEGGDQ